MASAGDCELCLYPGDGSWADVIVGSCCALVSLAFARAIYERLVGHGDEVNVVGPDVTILLAASVLHDPTNYE